MKKYLKNFQKIFEPKVFSDISQSAASYKHHICYGKSFKKFNGGGGGGGLFDYSVSPGPFLDLDLDLELDNIYFQKPEIGDLMEHWGWFPQWPGST